jgi:hypothetical protein
MSQYVTKIRTNVGDLPIDYNALANKPTISNPNLLINGDFQIWQRGESFSNIENKYTADRWMIKNAKSKTPLVEKSVLTPNGTPMCQSMHIQDTADENTYLAYNFETAIKGTYTLSFWYFSTTPISTYIHGNGSYVKLMDLTASSVWISAHVSFYANAVDFINIIHAMNAGECYITGIKLEVGTSVTPFSPKLYAEELALCQRYYSKLSTTYPLMMTQRSGAESFSYMHIPLSVSLRDKPTVKYSNVKLLRNGVGGDWWDVENVTCIGFSRVSVTIQINIMGSYEAGIPYFLILPNSGYIEFDAEVY